MLWGSLSCSAPLTHSLGGDGDHRYLCYTVLEPIQNIRSTRDTCAHSLVLVSRAVLICNRTSTRVQNVRPEFHFP